MKIFSWNVAGLRARLKSSETKNNSLMIALFSEISESKDYNYYDIVCLQETKCTENEVTYLVKLKLDIHIVFGIQQMEQVKEKV